MPVLIDPEAYHFQPGRSHLIRDGMDVTIIASGIILQRALQATELLEGQGIHPRPISSASIKPIDRQAILDAAQETGCIVAAENHNILGGLGGAVGEVVTSEHPVPVVRIGMRDVFGEVGTPECLANWFQMNTSHVVDAVHGAIRLKGSHGG